MTLEKRIVHSAASEFTDVYLIVCSFGFVRAIRLLTQLGDHDRLRGACLGGALATMTATYLDEMGDDRLNTVMLLNTMVDFSDPGILGRFTDEGTVVKLERKMRSRSYLEGGEMAGTFDLLRPNDLIFNDVVANWMLGKQPPGFDILASNSACRPSRR